MRSSMLNRRTIFLILALAGTSVLGSSASRERRHVGTEESGRGRLQEATSHGTKSSTSRNNEITGEPGRKVSHRLVGGHMRVEAKRDETFWDDGILMSSSGNGKEAKAQREEDDEKKTLSQQVKEGKYGLIQNEIHGKRPKRPGIISYLGNPEVPRDTIDNLGGLDEDEIWLAENHVLVLRGGKFPGHEGTKVDGTATWPPIDDYKAPRRQVKIPARPKVPPPFPVQLTEGGPIQILGTNGTRELANDTKEDYTRIPGEGFAIVSNGTIVRPDLEVNITMGKEVDKAEIPPVFYHALPPGAVFVPPPVNQTDYEEEDQSIYYPPPYSFQYQQDNTTAVPPGPLVPGIILPPPPDFFAALDEKKTTTKKYTKRPWSTPAPRARPTYLPPRKLTTKRYKTSTVSSVETRTSTGPVVVTRVFSRPGYRNVTTSPPTTVKTVPYVEITTPTADKTTTLGNTGFYGGRPANQVSEASTRERSRAWSEELATGKTVPIVAYYATTQSTLEKPVEVTPASIKNIVTTDSTEREPNHASYYFYEETNIGNTATTPDPSEYQRTTTESPYLKVEISTGRSRIIPEKQYYSVESIPSQQTSKDYTVKILDALVRAPQAEYADPTSTQKNGPARSQGQRMLSDQAPVYYQAGPASYYTTPRPQTYYIPEVKSKPIYQYSFEAADYSKRGGNPRNSYRQQQQSLAYDEYQQTVKTNQRQYEYESVPEQPRPNNRPFKPQSYYPSTTGRPLASTTENPQHAYFTRQDETLLDDVTKEYFTIFGKKLPGKGVVPSTTPIYNKATVTEKPEFKPSPYIQDNYNRGQPQPVYKTPNVRVHYGDQSPRPYSLKDDTLVNYKHPLPPINPDSEFITVVDPKQQRGQLQLQPRLQQQRGQPQPQLQQQRGQLQLQPQLQQQRAQPQLQLQPQQQRGQPQLQLQQQRGQPQLQLQLQPQPQRQGVPSKDYRVDDQGNRRFTPIQEYTPQQLVYQSRPSPDYGTGVGSPEELDETYPDRPLSLADDIEVNYRDPRPTINPDAEFIDPVAIQAARTGNPRAYFAYRFPGDGGHFYFLTPQTATQRPESGDGYLYPKPGDARLLRRRRRPGSA